MFFLSLFLMEPKNKVIGPKGRLVRFVLISSLDQISYKIRLAIRQTEVTYS